MVGSFQQGTQCPLGSVSNINQAQKALHQLPVIKSSNNLLLSFLLLFPWGPHPEESVNVPTSQRQTGSPPAGEGRRFYLWTKPESWLTQVSFFIKSIKLIIKTKRIHSNSKGLWMRTWHSNVWIKTFFFFNLKWVCGLFPYVRVTKKSCFHPMQMIKILPVNKF